MDWSVVEEILKKNVHHQTNFYTQDCSQFNHMPAENKEKINWLKVMNKRLDSGNSALEVALDNKHKIIYMIGFDYNTNDKLPNVYHGTINYARNSTVPAAESMAREWQQRLKTLVKKNPDTQIIRVNGSNTVMNIDQTNYSEITIEQFKEIYDSRN
jgi:NADH:ubiquinone oxidoreductase subunit